MVWRLIQLRTITNDLKCEEGNMKENSFEYSPLTQLRLETERLEAAQLQTAREYIRELIFYIDKQISLHKEIDANDNQIELLDQEAQQLLEMFDSHCSEFDLVGKQIKEKIEMISKLISRNKQLASKIKQYEILAERCLCSVHM